MRISGTPQMFSLGRGLLLVLVGIPLAVAALTLAAPRAEACLSGEFCLYEHEGYGGGLHSASGDDANLSNNYFPGTTLLVENNASSLKNNGTPQLYDNVRYYDGRWYSGASWCLPQGYSDWSLADGGGWWNDRISSFSWVYAC